jgi:uncharacterized membrane protein
VENVMVMTARGGVTAEDSWDREVQAQRDARFARRQAARDQRRGGEGGRSLLSSGWGRVLVGAVALLAGTTLAGLLALWPGAAPRHAATQAMGGATAGAEVVGSGIARCQGPAQQSCRVIRVRVDGGAPTTITLGPVGATAAPGMGAKIRVARVDAPPGARHVEPYSYAGLDRRAPLLWALVAFAVLVVVITRVRGLLALGGFALSLLLMTKFLVPAILAGSPGLLVALVGALAVMFVTVLLTYGISAPSLAACLGIGISLLLAALAAAAAADAAGLDGRSSELSSYLSGMRSGLSLQGVVLAGMVIGALGVLADMGVTQASAVMALRRADPAGSARLLYRRGFTVGRDHLVATTHTLVLVYVGATLPLLLVMNASGVGFTDAVNTQDLAEPILGTLIGASALLVSVPLTTALTVAVVARIPAAALGHVESHHH